MRFADEGVWCGAFDCAIWSESQLSNVRGDGSLTTLEYHEVSSGNWVVRDYMSYPFNDLIDFNVTTIQTAVTTLDAATLKLRWSPGVATIFNHDGSINVKADSIRETFTHERIS
ncbi:MAG: hypothetical protein NVS3B13_40510 [Mucilaginibacter sp.]